MVIVVLGGQGRIRTFVPRKEGQIYSLLALTTHPPVRSDFQSITRNIVTSAASHQSHKPEDRDAPQQGWCSPFVCLLGSLPGRCQRAVAEQRLSRMDR